MTLAHILTHPHQITAVTVGEGDDERVLMYTLKGTDMSKTYINPKNYDFAKLEMSEVDEFYGWEDAEEFVKRQAAEIKQLKAENKSLKAALYERMRKEITKEVTK